MTTALITGATAGLGAEFCRQLAAAGHSLILVARDQNRLSVAATELSDTFGVEAETLQADLVTEGGLERVAARLMDTQRPVDLLVNNAGFGLVTTFHESELEDERRHLDLLVTAPMHLTHAALGVMVKRGSGTIINVASVAGYTPRGSYGAAKAWLLNFSQWANIRYRRDGVTVTAVAPGFVHTEFHQRMNARTDNIPRWMWLTPETVVRDALKAASRGTAITIPSFKFKVVVLLTRILPKRVVAAGALRGR